MQIKIFIMTLLLLIGMQATAMNECCEMSSGEAVFSHTDLWLVLMQTVVNNEPFIKDLSNSLRSLACVNKSCNNMWEAHKFDVAYQWHYHYKDRTISTAEIARAFKWREYVQKISNLFSIVRDYKKSFDENDTKDLQCKFLANAFERQSGSLLYTLMDTIQDDINDKKVESSDTFNLFLCKLETLITSKITFCPFVMTERIRSLIHARLDSLLPKNKDYYLSLIAKLIHYTDDIDYRHHLACRTLLMFACEKAELSVCSLLLCKGSNPYYVKVTKNTSESSGWTKTELAVIKNELSTPENLRASKENASDELKKYTLCNAFDLCPGDTPQQKKDWLQRIIDSVAKEKAQENSIT